MKSGVVLDADEVRHIIAEHFNVSDDEVIKAKYSYIVINAKCRDLINEGMCGGRHDA